MTLLDTFLIARTADGLRARTLDDYRRVLTPYLDAQPIPGDWTRATIRAYVAALRARPWAPATIGLHVRYLRAFWGWCYREGLTAEDFSAVIPAPGRTIREETLLTTDEFAALVGACSGDRWAQRDRAILLILVDTGLRRKEFVSLQRAQIVFENGTACVLLSGKVTKSGVERFVFLGATSTTALRAYLETRADVDPALFVSERGPLGGDGLYAMLRRRAEQAGLDPTRVHPHLLRKMFASWWIENGGDEQRLLDLGGWSGPEMLRIYVRLGARQKLQEAHRQFGPVDRIIEE